MTRNRHTRRGDGTSIARRYARIEAKRVVVSLGHMLVGIVLMSAVLVGAALGVSSLMTRSSSVSPITVCMAGVKSDPRLSAIMQAVAGSQEGVSLGTLRYINTQDEARDMVVSGECSASIWLPDGFYDDLVDGTNTPAVIYLPDSGAMGTRLFREVVDDFVSLLSASEAGTYSAIEQVRETRADVSDPEQMGDVFAMAYAKACFARLGIFSERTYSPVGTMGLHEYYLSVVVALLTFGIGLNFGFLFTGEDEEMERKLRVYGVSAWLDALIKTGVIGLALWTVAVVLLMPVLALLTHSGGIALGASLPLVALRLLPGALMMGAFDTMMYTLTRRSEHAGLIFLLVGLVMVFAGGCILPSTFLPAPVAAVGDVLPLAIERGYAADALTAGRLPVADVLVVLAVGALMVCVAVVCDKARHHELPRLRTGRRGSRGRRPRALAAAPGGMASKDGEAAR